MRIAALMRYPLKSALGERLDAVAVEADGFEGDRTWACLDDATGTVGSAKSPRRWGGLLSVTATCRDGGVVIRLGGGTWPAGDPAADAALSAHLGRPVRLSRDVPAGARLHRLLPDEAGLVPDWFAGSRPGEELVTDLAGRRFLDFGAVHVVTTGALDALGFSRADAVRFRPNLVLDAPADPPPGTELRIGDVVLRMLVPTPRCVVPTLAHGPVPASRAVLPSLPRLKLPGMGRAVCFGGYAEVVEPGVLSAGQAVR